MSIGIKIKEHRIKSGLTQKDLADNLHVTYQAVSKWENDNSEPSFDTLNKMCKLFNCNINDFFDSKEKIIVENNITKPTEIEKISLGICANCGKTIYEKQDYNQYTDTITLRNGKQKFIGEKKIILCSNCLKRKNEERIEKKIKEQQIKRQTIKDIATEKRKKSFILSSIASSVFLIAALIFFFMHSISIGIAMLIASALSFTFVGCLILKNTFIAEMWLEISSWGIVTFPGLIFSLDIDGIVWFISMKIILFILGMCLSLIAILFATVFSSVISVFVYPFAIIKNSKQVNLK